MSAGKGNLRGEKGAAGRLWVPCGNAMGALRPDLHYSEKRARAGGVTDALRYVCSAPVIVGRIWTQAAI